MARILAIDTTSDLGSLALLEDDCIVEESIMRATTGFSPVVFGEIEALLARHDWPLGSIDCFAGAAGPGSFTGVRVCLTAVKGLAEATGKPAMGVSNLQALAAVASGHVRAVWIDARRGEIYGGLYNDQLHTVAPEVVTSMERWRASLPMNAQLFHGDGQPLAAAIARIAMTRYRAGEHPDPAALDANYVRRSDAELFWKEI